MSDFSRERAMRRDDNSRGLDWLVQAVPTIQGFVESETRQEEGIMSKDTRDLEKGYTNAEFAAKLRRLADCVESGENFEIQVAGERIYVPDRATFTIEHERDGRQEELEFQVCWTVDG